MLHFSTFSKPNFLALFFENPISRGGGGEWKRSEFSIEIKNSKKRAM